MNNRLTYIICGLLNQHQIWFKQAGESETAESGYPAKEDPKVDVKVRGSSLGGVYGLGMMGASVYYIKRANTFQQKCKGIFRAAIWPATLVYELLQYLQKD
jgi:hypothetical protein